MIQNLNLYPEYLRPKPVVLPFRQGLALTVMVLIALLSVIAVLAWKNKTISNHLRELTNEFDSIQSEIKDFEDQNVKKSVDLLLQKKEAVSRRTFDKRTALLSFLDEKSFGYSGGYSKYFYALAKQHVNGLWLTKVYLKEDANEMKINGVAESSDLVPKYIQNLEQESAFDNVVLTDVQLERSKIYENYIEFEFSVSQSLE